MTLPPSAMKKNAVILSLNSGSSSLKFAIFRCSLDGETTIAEGAALGIGLESGTFSLRRPGVAPLERSCRFSDQEAAVSATMTAIGEATLPQADAVGHRVVHGGPRHRTPVRIDDALLASLRTAIPYAPVHLPAEIRAIEVVATARAGLPQVACFDTGFYRELPELVRRFPLPISFHDRGLFRYGFHGLSYEYVVETLRHELGRRSVLAHLGNGASMTAVRDGRPVDTTMGLTPAGGFMMGTRSGDLDPGLLLHLLEAGHDAGELDRIVNRESGLLGVSGSSADMKTLLGRRHLDERALLACEMFSYQARKSIGALAAALGGVDSLVFTGGIGQNAPPVRERICAGLEFLGIQIDPERNRASADVISPDGARCTVRVVATDEELMIARHTWRLLFAKEAG